VTTAADMRVTELDEAYAEALLELAESEGRLDEIADEVEQLRTLLGDEPDLLRLLGGRALSAEERRESLDKLFEGRVDELTLRFLRVVSAKSRMDRLPAMLAGFTRSIERRRGVEHVTAAVASELDDEARQSLAERIGEAIGKQVVLEQVVEPALIGGLRLRIGDRVIDGTVLARLRQIEEQLREAGRRQASSASLEETQDPGGAG